MPGASAASAPSIRLSHFLFAHLLHGFILPSSLAHLLLRFCARLQQRFLPSSRKIFRAHPILGKQNGYDCVRDRTGRGAGCRREHRLFRFPTISAAAVRNRDALSKNGQRRRELHYRMGLLCLL